MRCTLICASLYGCRLFGRALELLGADYTAQGVWERFIAYEAALEEHQRAAQLYSDALRKPLKNLDGLLAQCAPLPASPVP